MSLRKSLLPLIASGLLLVGCSKNPFVFDGQISGVRVRTYTSSTLLEDPTVNEVQKRFDYYRARIAKINLSKL